MDIASCNSHNCGSMRQTELLRKWRQREGRQVMYSGHKIWNHTITFHSFHITALPFPITGDQKESVERHFEVVCSRLSVFKLRVLSHGRASSVLRACEAHTIKIARINSFIHPADLSWHYSHGLHSSRIWDKAVSTIVSSIMAATF